ncbi:transmembrane anti-sigma factor [Amycolatopsis methanolica 239]|uniref:Transmembrane anti-sigma factor n=1 Tax=Amycolatopsis methanolica 239 TaxID=1068978 RepID=A0A076MVZ3_AMYME|nr:transmembrane anti-sigma factor [Amycolatopsis methanolica 239]
MPVLRAAKRTAVADEALIRTLYEEHGRALLAYAHRLTGDHAAAEDAVQETLVWAWRHPDTLVNGKGSVRGWLLTVVRNIVADRFRAKAARPPRGRGRGGGRMTIHDPGALAAHLLEALEHEEMRAMQRHLNSCRRCQAEVASLRMARAALEVVPPEAMLDGPPDGGDLLLRRTLGQVRRERDARVRRNRLVDGAAAVAIALGAGGVVLGRTTVPPTVTAQEPGTRTVSGTDAMTGATMSVAVRPAAGWVRLTASVGGIPAGQKCRLVVVARDGSRVEAGSWLVSPAGERDGTALDGFALVAPAEVAAVVVENLDGRRFVEVPV